MPKEDPKTVFLLSPARSEGPRATMLLDARAGFELARRVQSSVGAPLGDVFAFISGLYFRGKVTYARRFVRAPVGVPGVLVISPSEGLRLVDEPITATRLRAWAQVDIDADNPAYVAPLRRHAEALAAAVPDVCRVVLLGSVASGKYVDPLLDVFGARLLFPRDFVGRGDMSRGGLLLRSSRAGVELPYAPVLGARRTGVRPPKLPRLRR